MSVAKLAYLTSPQPGRHMLNIQLFGSDELLCIEIGRHHLVNILVDGTTTVLREDQFLTRVPVASQTERNADERTEHRT
jgi:hypothetical protein